MNLTPSAAPVRLAALLTCHNRKATTLACLAHLNACTKPAHVSVDTVVVDDGSTDGTAEAIAQAYPGATIIGSPENLFWNRGMYRAFQWAMDRGYDYYLWLNDDTLLSPDAIERLISTAQGIKRDFLPGIIVGSVCDPDTGELTYGGLVRRQRWRPLKFSLVSPSTEPIACDTMNGNCVLVPTEVAAVVGNLDLVFEHAMGDFDYALRAQKKGIGIWIAPGLYGTCRNNSVGVAVEPRLRQRLRSVMNRKNLPVRSWWTYVHRHAGLLGTAYWFWPYLKAIFPPRRNK